MSSFATRRAKIFLLFVLLLLGLVCEYYMGFSFLLSSSSRKIGSKQLEKVKESNKHRLDLFYTKDDIDPFLQWKEAPDLWIAKGGVREMMLGYLNLHNSTKEHIKILRKDCARYKTQIQVMEDAQCRAEWRFDLFSSPIIAVDEMLGFNKRKLGAMKLKLSSGRWAWFKPCGEGVEMPENEVIASLLAETLQYHRVAPVVMRNISTSTIKDLLSNQYAVMHPYHSFLKQQIEVCSFNGIFVGAMIGWWDNVKETKTIFKKLLPEFTKQDAIDIRYYIEDYWASQITENHTFFSILGLIRTLGYNENIILDSDYEKGTLIALDLDRVSFTKGGSLTAEELTICFLCKISEENFTFVRYLHTLGTQPAEILKRVLLMDIYPMNLSYIAISRITERIKIISNCFQNCVAKFPSNAIIKKQPN